MADSDKTRNTARIAMIVGVVILLIVFIALFRSCGTTSDTDQLGAAPAAFAAVAPATFS